jgi:broad specificity phosphatase PhoE
MLTPTTLYLLRHAEVEESYHRIFGGQIDMNLSARGQEQAIALADYFKDQTFDALYASPMKRVQQTLQPLVASGKYQPIVLNDLREVHFGDWTGLNFDQVMAKFNLSAYEWLRLLETGGIPNAENGKTFRARIEPCVERILRDHSGKTVAVACHGGVIRMILSILMDLPLSKMALFEVEYASVTRVIFHPQKTELQLLNFTPWRDLP